MGLLHETKFRQRYTELVKDAPSLEKDRPSLYKDRSSFDKRRSSLDMDGSSSDKMTNYAAKIDRQMYIEFIIPSIHKLILNKS